MAEPLECEVAIVGGGPAGSSTALHLVRREGVAAARVLILDKERFPRDKPCAGAVSQLGLEVLSGIRVDVDVPSVAMNGVRVRSGDDVGETIEHMGVCIRRTEFDAHLVASARGDGVRVLEGEGLRALRREPGGAILTTSAGRAIRARLVAAADGAGSTTRKLLGLREPDRKGHLYVLDTEPVSADSGVARGLVDFDLAVLDDGVEGYYWDFPTVVDGGAHVSRGIYHANLTRSDTPSGESVKVVLARALARRGIDVEQVKLRPFSTRPFVPGSTAWVRGVVLVGEACGIDQTTGEGIAQSLEMGRIAARHLALALRADDDRFIDYERALRASVTGRHMLESARLARLVYGRVGRPARRYLVRSSYARRAALKWYRGEALPASMKVRLGLGLAASAFV